MTKWAIWGMALAAAFAVSMTMLPALGHLAWQPITPGSVSITSPNPNLTQLSLTASGTIPKQFPDLVGYAWLYASGPNSAYAITSHQSVRDSHQNPDGWHAHNVVLAPPPPIPDTDGVLSTFCVAAISDAPTSGISIKGSSVTVNARTSTLTGSFAGVAASFDIVIDAECPITVPTPTIVPGGLPLGVVVDNLTA